MEYSATQNNSSQEIINIATQKQPEPSKKPEKKVKRKSKKTETASRNALFLILLLIFLLAAFSFRAKRSMFEKEHPNEEYIQIPENLKNFDVNDTIDYWKVRVESYIPNSLPSL